MKKNCKIHPEKTALNFCHICGEYFCDACLSEGIEYYYCQREPCQQFYLQELAADTIDCLNCGQSVTLSREMRIAHTYQCPHCHQVVKYRREALNPHIITAYNFYLLIAEPFNFHQILFSLNTDENNTLTLVVYRNTHLSVFLKTRNEYGLRYHYQATNFSYHSVQDQLSSVQVIEALTGFLNHQHAWKGTIEWEQEVFHSRFWDKNAGQRLKNGIIWVLFMLLVQGIFYYGEKLGRWLTRAFEYIDKL